MIAYANSDCKNHPDEKEKNTKPFSWRLDGMKLYVTFENTPEGFSSIKSISNNKIIFENVSREPSDPRFDLKVVKIDVIFERLNWCTINQKNEENTHPRSDSLNFC